MKLLYLLIGIISLVLGLIGAILPILPTTPFLLLAAYCFARSSKRFHNALIASSFYKKHLESFVEERAMCLSTKVKLLSFASTMLLLAMYFIDNIYLRFFLFLLILFKYYYFIFRIKTIPTHV